MFSTRPFMLSPMLSPATSLGAINRKFHQVPIGLSSVLAAPSLSFCYYMYIIITLTPSSSPNYRRHISLNNRHHQGHHHQEQQVHQISPSFVTFSIFRISSMCRLFIYMMTSLPCHGQALQATTINGLMNDIKYRDEK